MTATLPPPIAPNPPTPAAPRPASRPSPGVRLAWIIAGAVLTVAVLGWGTFQVIGLLAHEEYDEETTLDAGGIARIEIDNDVGPVIVRTGVGDAVRIEAHVSEGLQAPSRDIEVVGDTLHVDGSCGILLTTWCSVSFTLTIPSGLDIVAHSDNSRVEVEGRFASVDAGTANGSVTFTGAADTVRLRSRNGSVRAPSIDSPQVDARTSNGSVRLTFENAPESVVATSANGDVEVVLPQGEQLYRVDADTSHGSTEITVRTDPESTHVIEARTRNGDVTVRSAS